MNGLKKIKGKVRLKHKLSACTTFKIGGQVKYFIEPDDIDDLKLLLSFSKRYKIPISVIGGGSNILASDAFLDRIVLRLSSSYFSRVSFDGNYVTIGAGAWLSRFVLDAQNHGLSGAEFLVGIPGMIGGALLMNAGTRDRSISQIVEEIAVMDYSGRLKTIGKKDIKFNYRESGLGKYIILGACLKLFKSRKAQIKKIIGEYISNRNLTQDVSMPSAGCIFKNPQGDSAGRLIDSCGLKGRVVGKACVSLRHANFILNLGGASFCDVVALMRLMKKEVKSKFKIALEPEVKLWQ